jgi:hypothetical protein
MSPSWQTVSTLYVFQQSLTLDAQCEVEGFLQKPPQTPHKPLIHTYPYLKLNIHRADLESGITSRTPSLELAPAN